MDKKSFFRLLFLMVTAIGLYFFANVQRVAIPGAIFNELQNDLSASAKAITLLGATFMYIYAFNQLFVGLLADRYGGERVIRFGGLLFCIGSVGFAFSNSLFPLYLCRILTGAGAAAIYLSIVKIIAERFPEKFTILQGTLLLCGYTGSIFANAPLVYCVHQLSWRMIFLGIGIATAVFYLLFLLSSFRVAMPPVREVPFSFRRFAELLKVRHNRLLIVHCACNFGIYYCIQTVIGKKFLEDFCQFSADSAACVMSILGILASVSGFSLAVISGFCGNRRKIFLVLGGISAVVCYGLFFLFILCDWRSSPLAVVLLCFIAWFSNQSPITASLFKETNKTEALGAIMSLSNCVAYLMVAASGNLVGVILDSFTAQKSGDALVYPPAAFLTVFGLFLACGIVTLVTALLLKESYGKNISSEIR